MSGDNRLPILAAEIDREHEAAHQAVRSALEHAAECGRLLLEAKELVQHGQWLPWLEANTSLSARQSQRYMRVATAVMEGKYDVTSHLTIESALDALATPKLDAASEPPLSMAAYLAENRPLEPEEIRIPIADVLPSWRGQRETVDPEQIHRLARYLPHLPPIEINQHYQLIDGWYRVEAHKLAGAKTIVAIVTHVEDEWHHARLWGMRNSRHGIPYTLEDERHQDLLAAKAGIDLTAMREEASKEARAEWWRKRRAGKNEHGAASGYPSRPAGGAP